MSFISLQLPSLITLLTSSLPLHLHTATQTSRCKLGGSLWFAEPVLLPVLGLAWKSEGGLNTVCFTTWREVNSSFTVRLNTMMESHKKKKSSQQPIKTEKNGNPILSFGSIRKEVKTKYNPVFPPPGALSAPWSCLLPDNRLHANSRLSIWQSYIPSNACNSGHTLYYSKHVIISHTLLWSWLPALTAVLTHG